ncbi:MAG: hypothetical protein JWN12_534 [Candidatus Saccharibacteria bacterium]|nr:hypothetical protein [Candidatus Saccharibacteria bacterium]
MKTRYELLQDHINDYGFSVEEISDNTPSDISISVVVPYFNTGDIFQRTLYFLHQSILDYGSPVEVIIIDDGSQVKPLDRSWLKNGERPIFHTENKGRTEARNTGIAAATGEVIFFMDSDILVETSTIKQHVILHCEAVKRGMKAIIISFFEFTSKNDQRINYLSLTASDLHLNDFRLDCTYEASWIGCEEDKAYIGQHLQLVKETSNLRDWRGQYKAWMLPNMILGGAFSVIKSEIVAVNGFDTRFAGYGFTETSAVTKMVTERNNVVIPSLNGGALHIEDEEINLPKSQKDEIFKDKHNFYFNVFLKEEVNV